jgi:coenzyme PQQ biosynthesis protein PqqD
MITLEARPRLASKARLRLDKKTGQQVLLYPEKGLLLNPTGSRILALCDGDRSVRAIVDVLVGEHEGADEATISAEVMTFLGRLFDAGLVRTEPD